MKKYDFAILATLLLGLVTICISIYSSNRDQYNDDMRLAKIMNSNIRRIEIIDCDSHIEIYHLTEQGNKGYNWRKAMYISDKETENITAEDGVLRMVDLDSQTRNVSVIKVKEGVEVVIRSSPNTRWLTDNEFQNRLKKHKAQYGI